MYETTKCMICGKLLRRGAAKTLSEDAFCGNEDCETYEDRKDYGLYFSIRRKQK